MACFRLLFLVFIVATLAQSTCIDKIREIQTSGRRMMGGYKPIANPLGNKVVKGIMADTVKEYNQRSNDVRHFLLSDNEVIEAYSQTVNGQNYCIEVTLESVGCKNNMNSEICSERKTVTCVVSAYKALSEKDATINRQTLECTASA